MSSDQGNGKSANGVVTAAGADEVEIELGPAEPPPLPKAAKDEGTAPMSVRSDIPARVWPPKVVGDVMTRKVITLGEHEPIGELEAWMKRFGFRHLPVVGEGMKLVGLITQTDLLHAALGKSPDGEPSVYVDAKTPAGQIMRKNVVTARVDSPLATAGRVAVREKLGCLPVVLDDNTLVGIVTITDFAILAVELLER